MQPAIAEDIKNMDTPVNWSYSAIYNTIMDLYKDSYANGEDEKSIYGKSYMTAERLYYLYAEGNQAVSPRWICENYITIAREEGLTAYNCYDVITKIIDNHNKDIQHNTQLKPIDKLQPEELVYWLPVAITKSCRKMALTYNDLITEALMNRMQLQQSDAESVTSGWTVDVFNACKEIKYDLNLYLYQYSINTLINQCKVSVFSRNFLGKDYGYLCSTWIDDVINYHNDHVRSIQNISGNVQ